MSSPYAPLSAGCRRSSAARRLILALPALCLLTACATDRVVVKPLAPPAIAPTLLRPVQAAHCDLTPGAEVYSGPEIAAVIDCWRNAWAVAAGKHAKLASAVKIREAKVHEAVKAAVR